MCPIGDHRNGQDEKFRSRVKSAEEGTALMPNYEL